jgi:hypothetical protein
MVKKIRVVHMTQFMLTIGNQPEYAGISFCSIDENDGFLKKIAHHLFTKEQLQLCWYPRNVDGELVDDLFVQAQSEILDGEILRETVVGKLLLNLFQSCQEVVLFYSSDFDYLPECTDIETAMDEISAELIDFSGEVYLRFINSSV